MSKLFTFLGTNLLTRSRLIDNKQYDNFIVTAQNKASIIKIIDYFNKYPLLFF